MFLVDVYDPSEDVHIQIGGNIDVFEIDHA